MFVTKAQLNRLADKFEKWAKEFEQNASNREPNVYQHFTGNARAYTIAADELRKLIKDS